MIQAFSTSHNRNRTLILFAVCGVLAIAAKAIGISDNPPGLLLAFLSASAFVLVFVHPWRTSKQFRYLIYASVLGFIVFVFLHNVFDFVASKSGGAGIVPGLLGITSAAFFIVATLLCPATFIVGAVGSVAMFIRSRRRPT
jgi:hypothetical protein